MTAIRLGLSELRRLTAGTLPRLAILALALIPTLYAGLYLFANHDPYDRLERVPAALVVQDEGADVTDPTTGRTEHRSYGDDVADELTGGDGGFGWVRTTQTDAANGVRSGRYDAELLIGPTFSADLASSGEFEPTQASLVLVTNDANNYLARTIATTIVDKVRDSIAEQVGTQAAETFLAGFAEIRGSLTDAVDGATQLADGAGELRDGAGRLHDGASTLADGAGTLADGASSLSSGAGTLHEGLSTADDGAQQLASGLGRLQRGAAALPGSTDRLATGAEQVADGADRLVDGARQVAAGNATVAGYGDQAAAAADDVVAAVSGARGQATARLDALVADGTLTREQADEVEQVLDTAQGRVGEAAGQVKEVAGRLDQLRDGSQQVADGAARLAAGSAQVADGARSLADAAPALVDGVDQASSGAQRLADGTGRLVTGSARLADGAAQLDDGASRLATGAGRLADGTADLVDGAGRLEDGAGQLRDGLADGVQRVPDVDERTREATATTIANPVDVEADSLSSAGTYGGGLAPFFLSLATWIGAYVLFLLVKPLSTRALAAGRSALWTVLGAWVVPFGIGVVQVAAMFSVTKFALDIDPAYGFGTAAFLVLMTATFVAVLQLLNVWLGAAGQFLGLVLMLVQLVTAGGTFPWQTLPEPLSSLHRMLPMSYTVEGLRQLLYGGNLATVSRDVGVLVVVLGLTLAATTLVARRQRVWTPNRLQPELVL